MPGQRRAVWGVSGWRKNNKIDRKTDDYVGEEDFVEDNIFGIQELNKVEKALTATSAIIYWKKMSASGLIMIISFCERRKIMTVIGKREKKFWNILVIKEG